MLGGVLTSLALAHEPAAMVSTLGFESFEESSVNSSRMTPYLTTDLFGMQVSADGWHIRDAGQSATPDHYAKHMQYITMMSDNSSLDWLLLHTLGELIKGDSLKNVVNRDTLDPAFTLVSKDLVHPSFTDAQQFLALLPEAYASSADVDWADDEVCIEWRTEEAALIATFEGDGAFGYALLRDGQFVPGDVVVTSISELPEDLVSYLDQHFSSDER